MQKDTILSKINNLKDSGSLEILNRIRITSKLSNNLLITGETGTGKDLLVSYLYILSNKNKFLELHCGNTPQDLIESDWFGNIKGAFTGASKDRDGKFTLAGDGILYLNQIDLLNSNIQRILLRLIERRKFFPVGSSIEKELKARLIFSVNTDITEKIRNGTFRNDLFYRISTQVIDIPPLRKRKDDIQSLFKYFADHYKVTLSFTKKGWQSIRSYPWPGNIREIENFISNISITSDKICDSDLHKLYQNSQSFLINNQNKELTLKEFEGLYIKYLLSKYKNKAKIARLLQISRKSLYNKLKDSNEKD
jgi:transcriptional regulator with PAS, ATPase and Fis domain